MSAGLPDAAAYALRLGDDALVLAQRLAEWAAKAPAIEEDVALTNIGLDLLGQARALLAYAGEAEGAGRSEDDLAYLRAERDFTNCLLVEQPNGDFAVTMARQLFFSAYQQELYRALRRSSDALLAGVAAKAVKEVAYHVDHAASWVARLGDGTPESRQRMTAAVGQMAPYAAELFESDDLTDRLVAAGVAADPAALQDGWFTTVDAALTNATLEVPEVTWAPTGGRQGMHSEHMGFLLAEMQHLHRSYPGGDVVTDLVAVRALVAAVVDPEIPVITIDDLGVLRHVGVGDDGRVEVTITPTYSGCPAMDVIRSDIRQALAAAGYDDSSVRTVLAPAWSTDWISDDGRRKLAEYGIAPPGPAEPDDVPVELVRCPQCGSAATKLVSRFGSTACLSQRACQRCLELPFDHFRSL